MALTKEQKSQVLDSITTLLNSSKMTVVANYQGTGVKQMQELRKLASENNTVVKVAKNRLVRQALVSIDTFKDIDTANLTGQLLYAFNEDDEVAPAQSLAAFAKKHPSISFVGALTAEGKFIDADEVSKLASLPSKDMLRAQLVGTISAPLTGLMNILSGNMRGFLYVLHARADQIK